MSRESRLHDELADMALRPPALCTAGPIDKDLDEWQVAITGPPTSPYCGGQFKLRMIFPEEYPQKPPFIYFITPIYHMNINPDGGICLDILYAKWAPDISVGNLLLSICNLLSNPNPDDPLDKEKCELYKSDRVQYSQNAQEWTEKYAV